jgi:hypothetical protein
MPLRLETERYFCYTCGPIDYWDGWRTVPELIAAEFARQTADGDAEAVSAEWLQESKTQRIGEIAYLLDELGEHLAEQLHWERDGQWRVTALPEPKYMSCVAMFAVKQKNNGLTFICSPYPLHWLEAELDASEIVL